MNYLKHVLQEVIYVVLMLLLSHSHTACAAPGANVNYQTSLLQNVDNVKHTKTMIPENEKTKLTLLNNYISKKKAVSPKVVKRYFSIPTLQRQEVKRTVVDAEVIKQMFHQKLAGKCHRICEPNCEGCLNFDPTIMLLICCKFVHLKVKNE